MAGEPRARRGGPMQGRGSEEPTSNPSMDGKETNAVARIVLVLQVSVFPRFFGKQRSLS